MILYSSTKVQLPKAFYKSIEKRSHWPRILLFIFIFPRHTSSYLWAKIDLHLLGCLANQKPQDKPTCALANISDRVYFRS